MMMTSKLVNQNEAQKLMNLSLENKVALVTGAASGMGLATAHAFAEAGAAVVLADFREDSVKAEAEKLTLRYGSFDMRPDATPR